MSSTENRALILIVDDDEDIRRLMCVKLEELGHKVAEAANGEVAIAMALKDLPDLILMDLSMPALDGFATMDRISRHLEIQRIPVIGVSAYTAPEIRADALTAGFHSFITKPVNFQELNRMIDEILFNSGS